MILDGTVVCVGLDSKTAAISLLVVIGVREDGKKVFQVVKDMGGETTGAWRALLDDLVARAQRRPEFLIIDSAPGLEKAIAVGCNGVPVQRCSVHKHRNLLGHVLSACTKRSPPTPPTRPYAATAEEIEDRRKAFVRRWRL